MPLSAIKGFFQSRFFEPQWKNKVFIAQVGMTTIAFCLGIAKLATKPSQIPMSRMDIMAITMSIKSFAFLAYEYFTEKVDRLKRFGSLKAYAILNTLDILFWMVVMGLTFSGVSRICIGANCGIGVLVALAALLNAFIHFWAAVIAWKNHVYFKRFGVPRGQDVPQSKSTYSPSSTHHHRRYHSREQNSRPHHHRGHHSRQHSRGHHSHGHQNRGHHQEMMQGR